MRANNTIWVAGVATLTLAVGGCAHRTAGSRATSPATQTDNRQNPQMQRFQQKYPGTAALMRSVMGVRILLQSNKHPLTPDQARNLDRALRPLPSMATLPQEKAQQLARSINGFLTPDQQTDIGLLRQSFRGRRGMRGGRPGGAGGPGAPGAPSGPGASNQPGGQGGRRMRWMREDMPANENIFRNGPAQQMLNNVLGQLQSIEKT